MKLNNSKFAGQDSATTEWFDHLSGAEWWNAYAPFHIEARHNFSPSADRIIQVTEGYANRNDFLIRPGLLLAASGLRLSSTLFHYLFSRLETSFR